MTPMIEALHRPAPAAADSEACVSHWLADYVAAGRGRVLFPFHHPRRAIEMLRHVRALPRIPVRATGTDDAAEMRANLRQPLLPRLLLGNAVCALPVPADAAGYLAGRPKHALRQRVRAAAEAGVRYRSVDDPAERAALMARADEYERTGAVVSTRNASASNAHLVPLGRWLLAEGDDGEPLLLAVVVVDGEVALLRYYRTLVFSEASSAARFGLMPHLVDVLGAAGVRVLLEAGRPWWTDDMRRQFQRKLGFRLVRVALESAPVEPRPSRTARALGPVPAPSWLAEPTRRADPRPATRQDHGLGDPTREAEYADR